MKCIIGSENKYSKKCSKCKAIKTIKNFDVIYIGKKHRRDSICRSCHNQQSIKDAREQGRL